MAPLEAGRHSGHDHGSGSVPYALLPAPAGVNLNTMGTLKDSSRLFEVVVSIKDEGMMLVITLVTMLTPHVASDCCFDCAQALCWRREQQVWRKRLDSVHLSSLRWM